jgi:hypothetical protein
MYYVEDNNKIVLFDEDKHKLQDTLAFMPQYKDLNINETNKNIINFNGEIYFEDDIELIQEREMRFEKEFFETSLGWVRRDVKMQDDTIRDFLSDILPLLQVGIPVLTYQKPDFIEVIEPVQNKVIVTEEFINECKQQVLKDFYGA